MQLTFLGTRGAHVEPGHGHHKHAVLHLEHEGDTLLIDCGSDWSGLLEARRPDALLLTHGHDDHVGGLPDAPPCPVWAGADTWEQLDRRGLATRSERYTLVPQEPLRVGAFRVTGWPIVHSFRAPALAYRISAAGKTLFYAPDIAALPDPEAALRDVALYIGDGTAFDASRLRVEQSRLCGHAPLPLQLAWCIRAGVPRMLVTHCGETLVSPHAAQAWTPLAQHAREHGITLAVAEDGEEFVLD